jgi:hypothetical protein
MAELEKGNSEKPTIAWSVLKSKSLLVIHSSDLLHIVKFNARYTANEPGKPNLLEVAAADFF